MNDNGPADEFRNISTMHLADRRNVNAPQIFAGQPRSVAEFHGWISKFELPRGCPDDVHTQFDLARNLYAYSWFVYRFTSPAQSQAYATMELALRLKFKELGLEYGKRRGLYSLLTVAIEEGMLKDGGFPHLRRSPLAGSIDPDGTEFCEKLPKIVANFRNSFAHGELTLLNLPVSLMALECAWSVINQLYSSDKKQ